MTSNRVPIANTRLFVCSVSTDVHASLLQILVGHAVPKNDRSLHDIAAYRIKGKGALMTTNNPLMGKNELIQNSGDSQQTILLKNTEVEDCIKKVYIMQNIKVQVQGNSIKLFARYLLE